MRSITWVGTVLAMVFFMVVGGGWYGLYLVDLRVATLVLGLMVLIGWTIAVVRDRTWAPSTSMWPAIAAVLVSLAASTITSREPRISAQFLAYSVVLVALYLLLVRMLAIESTRRTILSVSSMLFVGLTVLYVASNLWHWVDWWASIGHLAVPPLRPEFESLTYGNPSAVLTMVALLAVPTLAQTPPTRQRTVGLVVGVALAIVALISGSRAGWVAIAGTFAAAAVWMYASRGRGSLVWVRERARVFVDRRRRVPALAALVLVAVLAVVLTPALAERIGGAGTATRLAFWQISIRLFLEAPITGIGPGIWAMVRGAETQPQQLDEYIPYAHNLEVQTLAELGLLGAVCGVVVIIVVGRLLVESLTTDALRRRWAIFAMFGLLYFVLHQQFDFYENMPAVMLAAVIPIAYLDATRPGSRHDSTGRSHSVGLILIPTIASVLTIALIVLEVPALTSFDAVMAANSGNWGAADDLARRAADEDPLVSPFLYTAGLTADRVGDHEAARQYFQVVADRDDLPEAWLNLAAEDALTGSPDDVVPALERALRLGFQRASVAFAAGELALRTGETQLAVRALADAMVAEPTIAADPWWKGAGPSLVFDQAVDQAIVKGATVSWAIALYAGRLDEAASLGQHTLDPSLPSTVISAWQGNQGSADRLFARCSSQPLDADVGYWCARLAGHQGDPGAQLRYRFIASVTPGGNTEGGAEIRTEAYVPYWDVPAGYPAIYWGQYVYRSFTPHDMLVPSLAHLVLR